VDKPITVWSNSNSWLMPTSNPARAAWPSTRRASSGHDRHDAAIELG
jgi:hypothetical protein